MDETPNYERQFCYISEDNIEKKWLYCVGLINNFLSCTGETNPKGEHPHTYFDTLSKTSKQNNNNWGGGCVWDKIKVKKCDTQKNEKTSHR